MGDGQGEKTQNRKKDPVKKSSRYADHGVKDGDVLPVALMVDFLAWLRRTLLFGMFSDEKKSPRASNWRV